MFVQKLADQTYGAIFVHRAQPTRTTSTMPDNGRLSTEQRTLYAEHVGCGWLLTFELYGAG